MAWTSFVNQLAKGAATAGAVISNPSNILSGAAYAATGGRVGTDLTPGYSASNVIRAQANNLFGGGQQNQGFQLNTQGDSSQSANNAQAALNNFNKSGPLNPNNAGGGQATSDPNLAARYGDQANQLQGQFGTLDNELNNGNQTIQNSSGQALGGVNDQFANAERQYNQNKQQNMKDYSSASSNARTQVRSQTNALQRLLAQNGAGNSSASYEQVPYAAALAGSQMIDGAQSTYAKNAANQDNNFAQTKLSTDLAKKKIATDTANQQKELQSKVDGSRATLLDQIRTANINRDLALGKNYQSAANNQAGTQNQVQSLIQQIQQLGQVNPVNYDSTQIKYATPYQSQYSLDGGPQVQDGGSGQMNGIDPSFLSSLSNKNKKRDAYGQPVFN